MLRARVTGSDIKILQKELVVTETINAYKVEFRFDSSWKDIIGKTAILYQPTVNRDNPVYVLLDSNNQILIPSSVLTAEDYLYIGVFGFTEDRSIKLSTVFQYVLVSQGCYERSKEPVPDPSVYEQIYLMASNALKISEDVLRRADSGEFDGFSPTITVKEDTPNSYILTITNKDGQYDTPNLIVKGSGDLSYIHNQVEPSSEWIIIHHLQKYPSVTVVDSAKTAVYGDVTYLDYNSLKITFSSEFTGTAYLN